MVFVGVWHAALVEENRAVIRRLKEVYAAQQNMYSMQVGDQEFSWYDEQMMMMMGDSDSSPKAPMAEDQTLSFNSLTIDPPNSLHDHVKY